MKMILILLSSLVLLSGCGSTRVVFVDTQSDLVRIGPDVQGRVYVLKNGEWILSKNKMKLPEGWYAGGIPREE
ncbi:MAG: hypothetical protein H8E05_01440 [Bacteroidetes bacterium]|nr:hypothetical protein [Bacteroidota bacterium]